MPRKFDKHKLLLDEGLFSRNTLNRTNNRHNVKHIKHDLNKGGVSDDDVYDTAVKQKRIIVTFNIKHFRKRATERKDTGVIGVSQGITPDKLDIKLNALLTKTKTKTLYGKYTSLSGESETIKKEPIDTH